MKQIFPNRVNQLIAAFIGTVVTWILNTQLHLDPVLASAAVSLCGAILTKKYHGVVMAGSFAGMSSIVAVPTWYFACLVAVLVFIIWMALEKIYLGCGGKYGTIAVISGFLAQFIIIPITNTPERWATVFFAPAIWPTWFGGALIINIPLCIILAWAGSFGTLLVRKNIVKRLWKEDNTTAGSAIVGLIGFAVIWGILLSISLTLIGEAAKLGAFVYMGSFAGMCSLKRLHCTEDTHCTSDNTAYSLNGLMTGILFLGTRLILPYGGLYGFTAFLSVLIYDYILAKYVLKEKPIKTAPVEKK